MPRDLDRSFNLSKSQADQRLLGRANALLSHLKLRRTKAEIEKSLPPKIQTQVNVPLSGFLFSLFFFVVSLLSLLPFSD